jgi:hypothetical protein
MTPFLLSFLLFLLVFLLEGGYDSNLTRYLHRDLMSRLYTVRTTAQARRRVAFLKCRLLFSVFSHPDSSNHARRISIASRFHGHGSVSVAVQNVVYRELPLLLKVKMLGLMPPQASWLGQRGRSG